MLLPYKFKNNLVSFEEDPMKDQLDAFFDHHVSGSMDVEPDDDVEEELDEDENSNDEGGTTDAEDDDGAEEEGVEDGGSGEGDQKEEDQEEDEVISLKKQNEVLLGKLEELAGKSAQEPALPTTSKDLAELFANVDPKQLTENPTAFMEFMLKFAGAVREHSVEQSLRATPGVMGSYLARREVINKVKENFYTNNRELAPVKNYVAGVANDVSAEHPDWTVQKVLDEAATRTYAALAIKKGLKQSADKSGRQKPVFAKQSGGNRNRKPELGGLQKQFDTMLKSLDV